MKQFVFNSEEEADKVMNHHGITPVVKVVLDDSCEVFIEPIKISVGTIIHLQSLTVNS